MRPKLILCFVRTKRNNTEMGTKRLQKAMKGTPSTYKTSIAFSITYKPSFAHLSFLFICGSFWFQRYPENEKKETPGFINNLETPHKALFEFSQHPHVSEPSKSRRQRRGRQNLPELLVLSMPSNGPISHRHEPLWNHLPPLLRPIPLRNGHREARSHCWLHWVRSLSWSSITRSTDPHARPSNEEVQQWFTPRWPSRTPNREPPMVSPATESSRRHWNLGPRSSNWPSTAV